MITPPLFSGLPVAQDAGKVNRGSDIMGGSDNTSGKFEGFRGVLNDIGLLLADLVGLGKPDSQQQMVIEVIFGLMGYVAKADRLVSSHESNLANTIMDETDLSMAARRIAMEAFERGMARNINVPAELLRFTDACPAGSPNAERLYDALLRLAASDGRLDPREYDTMVQVTQQLGLPAATLENKLAMFNVRR
ncbi:TerB family tellurite resistance protein [Thermomonas paludicola]|uniref:TerB family tellurite resistance protein n=1 Tax=Thermomonas paludicola TaxID=2884874 RepID=UPI00211562D2|nr:TerB family tellurite resistance protein [Thermomonas paludicola]